jgi:hypothetical protein
MGSEGASSGDESEDEGVDVVGAESEASAVSSAGSVFPEAFLEDGSVEACVSLSEEERSGVEDPLSSLRGRDVSSGAGAVVSGAFKGRSVP